MKYGCGSTPMGSHFGVGAPPILVNVSGEHVHRRYGLLTHAHMTRFVPALCAFCSFRVGDALFLWSFPEFDHRIEPFWARICLKRVPAWLRKENVFLGPLAQETHFADQGSLPEQSRDASPQATSRKEDRRSGRLPRAKWGRPKWGWAFFLEL